MTRGTRELLLRGGTLVTCDERGRVLRGDLLIKDGAINALGKVRAARDARIVDARDRIVMPGLVMAHVHLCQTLMRGMADDLPLLEWLNQRIWPLEAAHDRRSLDASAELGLAELVRAGVTSVLDFGTVRDHEVVFDACLRAGIRVVGGKALMDRGPVRPRLHETTAEALRDAERLERDWGRHPSGRTGYVWLPRFVLSCSEELVRGAVERAESSGSLLHTHAAEHAAERASVRRQLGADDVTVLRRWGVHGPRCSLAHGVKLTDREIARLARDQTRVVHCPSANLKLGSGIARVAELCNAGVVVGLGADGAPCNNNLDPWVELRHAALLSSVRASPGALSAQAVLRMATLDGAQVLGLADRIGSLEIGKRADVVVVRTLEPHLVPARDPVATLVYATQSRDVEHVFVDGQPLVEGGELVTLEQSRVVARARAEAGRLARRAGI
jgi:5-methylthioadenosine/S-adenosylhomocysteine deaminase